MKILIADSQPKVRYALSILLQEQPGWIVAGAAIDSQDLISKADLLNPDLVLLDWDLPGLSRADLVATLRQMSKLRLIAMSANPEVRQQALRIGFDFFISKVDSPKKLLEAIRRCELPAANAVE
jgi:DNA-binding NarL/FixJ family response regulator